MGVKLKERINGDGTTTFYLDIFFNKKRWTEFLTSIKLTNKPATPADRQKNKENRATAKQIAIERARVLQGKDYNVETEKSKLVVVIDWMNDYAKNYDKADIRVIDGVIKRFSTFLHDNKKSNLLMRDFNNSLVKQFRDRLEKECIGEGARSYYARFTKIVRQAYEDNLLLRNPCEGVKSPKGKAEEKDILTSEELQLVAQTPTEAPEVKRAFMFSAVTGLRWIDVKNLTWGAINMAEREMRVMQSKTSRVAEIPLNGTAIALLGKEGGKKELVFDLPTANGCNKSLKALVTRAGIDKSITWHCGRHSFGTNLVLNGADIHTTSKLLGHAGLSHTVRYVRASKELNKKAVESLPEINLNNRIVEEGNTFEITSVPKPRKAARTSKPVKTKEKK
jgi:integrase/recombinase XerD